MNFDQFGFSEHIRRSIARAGYQAPTPIQREALPAVMSGKDVVGLAQTGTGKTAAFVLPLIQGLYEARRQAGEQPRRKELQALILAPTRELAEQIEQVIRTLGHGTGVRSALIIGGVSSRPQIDAIRAGVDVVVACPGRLIDLVQQKVLRLSSVTYFVLDEADQMFDMGFFPSIRRILSWLPKNRQNLMFSATMPQDISRLAEETLNDPVRISVAHSKPIETVAHAVYAVPADKKIDLLISLMPSLGDGSILVFTRTKHRAKRLSEQLERQNYRSTSLQGNLSQNRRKEAMDGFRKGKYQVMVATDIAARGIDVSEVTHVINFDVPDTPEAYTHRIGRTGRAAKNGDALTFVTTEDADLLRAIERHMGKSIDRKRMDGFPEIALPQGGSGGHNARNANHSRRPRPPGRHAPGRDRGPARGSSFGGGQYRAPSRRRSQGGA